MTISSQNDSNAESKKRNDLAKRIVEAYVIESDSKLQSDKSTLSYDLMSRLNFNPNSPVPTAPSKVFTKVTFNEDSLNKIHSNSSKVVVSSTTNDDDLAERHKLKRKLNDKDEKVEPEVKFRGFNNNQEQGKIITLKKSEPKKTLTLNAKPVKLSENVTVMATGKRVLQSQVSVEKEKRKIIRSGLKSDFETAPESVFNRISITDGAQEKNTKKLISKPIQDSVAVTRRLLGEFSKKTESEPVRSVRIEPVVKKTKFNDEEKNSKANLVPIKFGSTMYSAKPKRSVQEMNLKKSLQSRISF